MIRYFIFFFFLTSVNAYSYVDLNLNYSYNQQIIDGNVSGGGEALSVTKTLMGSWSWYLWEYTAIEFTYSRTDNNVKDTRPIQDSGGTFLIKKVESNVITDVMGVGIRQSFANRKSRLIPSLGLGFARVVERGNTIYTVNTGGADQSLEQKNDEESFNSSYLTLSLRIRLTELMGINLGARTVVPDFDTSKASKNMTYHAGFSWIF